MSNLPATDQLHAHLNRLADGDEFRRSPRLVAFLRYVCDRALKKTGDEINEYAIAVEVFNRSGDFSPATDAVVRVQAHTLRKKLTSYYAADGAKESFRIELPLGGYQPIFSGPPVTTADSTAAVVPVGTPKKNNARIGVA